MPYNMVKEKRERREMDLYDRTYQAIHLPGTTLGEAIGIVWACGYYVDGNEGFETEDDAREFRRMWDAIFSLDGVNFGEIDRVPEDEYGDNVHRTDGEYCVRLSVFSYAEEDWDETHEYLISIGTSINAMRPNLKVCFQRVHRDAGEISRSATFKTLRTVHIDESMIDFLLKTK